MKRVFSRTSYKERKQKTQKVALALLRKEFLRLIKNPMIVLNTMLGSVMFILFAVYVFSQKSFLEMIEMLGTAGAGAMPIELLFMGIFCMIATMNMSAASSVSLEGETLWTLRTLPIPTKKILFVKAFCQFIATLVPAFVSIVAVGIYVKFPIWCIFLTILILAAFTAVISLFGVAVNLKFPNLHWTNEVAVVKQSLSTFIDLFGGIAIFALLVGGYFLFGKYMLAWAYALLCFTLLVGTGICIWLWLCKKGVKLFENL
jgi:ABC-2 type transport system permease protein